MEILSFTVAFFPGYKSNIFNIEKWEVWKD